MKSLLFFPFLLLVSSCSFSGKIEEDSKKAPQSAPNLESMGLEIYRDMF